MLLALVLAIRGRSVAASVAAGLGVVARPEGATLLPILGLLVARAEARAPDRARRLAQAAAAAVLPASLYMAFCLHATGSPLLNTFYAKFAPQRSLVEAISLGWTDYVHGNLPYFTFEAGSVLALIGAAALVRRAPLASGATLGFGLAMFAATLGSREFSAGHYHYWERWLIPSFPMLMLAMAAGVGEIGAGFGALVPGARRKEPGAGARAAVPDGARSVPASPRAPAAVARTTTGRARRGWSLAALAAFTALAAGLPRGLKERADTFAWNCQNIDEMNVALGRWVDAHVPRDAVVAVGDAGALRYFGNRVTIDLAGLNDHRIRAALAKNQGVALLGRERVGWFVVFPAYYRGLVEGLRLTPVHAARAPHYTVSGAAQDLMVVYRWDKSGR